MIRTEQLKGSYGNGDEVAALDLPAVLEAAARANAVPGMSAAVLREGRLETAVHGVTHVGRPAPVTTATAFGLQSVSKVLNATLVLLVLADRLEDLDLPVTTWLEPGLFSRPDLAERVTLRQLLSHTSGLDSELFPADCGEGDDALTRWAGHLRELPFVAEPGEVFSYSNAGVVLAGHVAERIEGRSWAALVRERMLEPLGIGSSWTQGEQPRIDDISGQHRTADYYGVTGLGPDAVPVEVDLAKDPTRGRAWGPCGGWVATPQQLVRWAAEHLDSGSGVVPPQVRAAMRVPHITKPVSSTGQVTDQCLGWAVNAWDGMQVLGHSGGGIGHTTVLRVVPEAGLVVAVTANVGDSAPANDVINAVLRSVPGLRPRSAPLNGGPASAEQRRRLLGTYERRHYRYTISEDTADPSGPLRLDADSDPAFVPVYTDGPVKLTPYADGSATVSDGNVVVFLGDDGSGSARWLHVHGRAHPRVQPDSTPFWNRPA